MINTEKTTENLSKRLLMREAAEVKKGTKDFTNDYMCSYQGASNNPIIMQIAESVCEKIRSGQYQEYSRYDGFGIYYQTDVTVDFPVIDGFNPTKDLDFDELYRQIDRLLRENSLGHYHCDGSIVPWEGDTDYTINLHDNRRPPITWEEAVEDAIILDSPKADAFPTMLMDDGLPF